jgi:UDP-N-acetylmuramoyl-L-alanyl-D-glutamate--2,6-diaminopimelate ligase
MNLILEKSNQMMFCAIRGTISDGHDYRKAILQGAAAVICDTFPENIAKGVTMFR